MKKNLLRVFIATFFAAMGVAALFLFGGCDGCGKNCDSHVDADYDSVCDICGKSVVAVKVENTVNGSVTADKQAYEIGETAVLTLVPVSGYKLETLTVNGVDRTAEVKDGKFGYTVAEGDAVLSVTVKFVMPVTLSSGVNNTEYGAVTFDKEKYNVGDRMVITCVPAEGYGVQCIKINGNDVTDGLAGDVYTVKAVQTDTVNIEVDFISVNATFDTVFAIDGKWRADGLDLTFTREGETAVTAGIAQNKCAVSGIKYGLWQVSANINGLPVDIGGVTVRGEKQNLDLGNMFTDKEAVEDKLSNIDLAHGAFDVKFVSYNNSGYVVTDKTLFTAVNAEQGDAFYALHISLSDAEKAEIVNGAGATRYFSIFLDFGDVQQPLNIAFTNTECVTNWSPFGTGRAPFASEFADSLLKGEGVYVVLQYVAENGNVKVYLGNSVTYPVFHTEYETKFPVNGTVKAIGLGDGLGYGGTSFSAGVEFSYGKTLQEAMGGAVYVAVNGGEAITGGTVTVNGGAAVTRGGEVALKVQPDSDCELVNLTVNGANYFGKLNENGEFVFDNYYRTNLKIEAEFIKQQIFDTVNLNVDEKWGADGVTVTLTRDGETAVSGVILGNKLTVQNVKSGVWQATVSFGDMQLSLGRVFVTDSEVALDLSNMFDGAATAERRISAANLQAGTFVYTTEPYENKGNTVPDTVMYFNNLRLPEGDLVLSLSLSYAEISQKTPYISVYFKTETDAKPITFWFARSSGNFWVKGGSEANFNLKGIAAADGFVSSGAKLYLLFKYDRTNGKAALYTSGDGITYALACTRSLGLSGNIKSIGFGDALGYESSPITFDLSIACKATAGELLGKVTASVNGGEEITGGTVTVNGGEETEVGGNISIALTPANGYILSSFTVNGENKFSEVGDNGGTYTVEGYFSKVLEITATFAERTAFDSVTFTVPEKWSADGSAVTLKKSGCADIAGTVADGKFTATNVEIGEWRVETEFAGMKLGGTVNVSAETVTLDLSTLFTDAATAERRISAANLSDGTFVYTTEPYDNKGNTVPDTVMYLNNLGLPEGDLVLSLSLSYAEISQKTPYISVYFKTETDAKPITFWFARSSGNFWVRGGSEANFNLKGIAAADGFVSSGAKLNLAFGYNPSNGSVDLFVGGGDGYAFACTKSLGLSGDIKSIGFGDALGYESSPITFNMELKTAGANGLPDVNFSVDSKWGADGLAITLSKSGEADKSAVVAGNGFALQNVKAGVWSAVTEIAGMKVSLGKVLVADETVKIDLGAAFADANTANARIASANLADGEFSYTFRTDTATALYLNNLDLKQGDYCLGVKLKAESALPGSAAYFSVYFRTAAGTKKVTVFFGNSGNMFIDENGNTTYKIGANGSKEAGVEDFIKNGGDLYFIFKYVAATGNIEVYIGGSTGTNYKKVADFNYGLVSDGLQSIGFGQCYGGGALTLNIKLTPEATISASN